MTNSARLASFLGSFPHGQLTVSIGGYSNRGIQEVHLHGKTERAMMYNGPMVTSIMETIAVMRRGKETEQKK